MWTRLPFLLVFLIACEAPPCPDGQTFVGAVPPDGTHAYCRDSQGRTQGAERFWDSSGLLRKEVNQRDGQAHGITRQWHPNGKLQSEGAYDAGKRVGLWKRFGEDGQLLRSETFGGGFRHGPFEERTADGRLVTKGTYAHGRKHGVWLVGDAPTPRQERWENGRLRPAVPKPPARVEIGGGGVAVGSPLGDAASYGERPGDEPVEWDRAGVPNLTLHLLPVPALSVRASGGLALDSGTRLSVVGESCPGVWTARHPRGTSQHFEVRARGAKLQVREASCDAAELVFRELRGPARLAIDRGGQRAVLTVPGRRDGFGWVEGSSLRGARPAPEGDPAGNPAVVVLGDLGLHAIRDLDRPTLEPVPGVPVSSNTRMAWDRKSGTVYIASWDLRHGGFPHASNLSRLDPRARTGVANLAHLGPGAPELLLLARSGRVLVYRAATGGPLLVLNAESGEVVHSIELKGLTALAQTTLLSGSTVLVGDRIVDIAAGREVRQVPGLWSGAPRLLVGEDLIFATGGTREAPSFTHLARMTLGTGALSAPVPLPLPAEAKAPGIRDLLLAPGGDLAVVTGDRALYPPMAPRGR